MTDPYPPSAPRRTSAVRRFTLTAGLAFLIGIVAMGWLISRWQPVRSLFIGDDNSGQIEAAPGVPAITVGPRTAPAAPEMSSPGGRNDALLVALAARRALDKGQGLGSIELLLRAHFAQRESKTVDAIVAAAKAPVTLESLKAGLDAVAPKLAGGPPDEGVIDALQRELGSLVVVRPKDAPSPSGTEAVAAAGRLVDSGRVDAALVAVERLPGAGNAASWLADARRYTEARAALDLLERAAMIMPQQAVPVPQNAPVEDVTPAAEAAPEPVGPDAI